MRFLNPIAWLGLVALAAPVIAHLFARRPARVQPFPTLRFLPASALRPVRRDRLSDLPLLSLRCLLIGVAVAALAGPSGARAGDGTVRAVIKGTYLFSTDSGIGGTDLEETVETM